MKINLRDFYPFYNSDFFIDVPEEIAHLFNMLAKKEHAEYELRRKYKAFYSLDSSRVFESSIVFLVLSPEEIFDRKLNIQKLYSAICSLPEKQARRIYAHFFLRINKATIARTEGVNEKAVRVSISSGIKNISKYLKNNS